MLSVLPPKTFVRSQNQMFRIPCSSCNSPPFHHRTPYWTRIHPSHDSPNPSLNLFPTLIHTFESIRYLKNQFLFLLKIHFLFGTQFNFTLASNQFQFPLNQIQITLKSNSFKIQFFKNLFLLLYDSISHVFNFCLSTNSILASSTQ